MEYIVNTVSGRIHKDSGKRAGYNPPRSYQLLVAQCGARLSSDANGLWDARFSPRVEGRNECPQCFTASITEGAR